MDEAAARSALRVDAGAEYQALIKVVSDFDGRLTAIKGWSVTLSLAGLGLGFQQGHYALFLLAALSGLAFYVVDAVTKRQQIRYYARMREIEVVAYALNAVDLDGIVASSPRIDWSWSHADRSDARTLSAPEPMSAADVRRRLRRAWGQGHVLLPRVLAVVLGGGLFVAAVAGLAGLDRLVP